MNRPSMFKFVQFLNSTNIKTLNNLAIFCIKSFKVRGMLITLYTLPSYVK